MPLAPLAFLRFETPGYLVLLALIPILVLWSYRSLSGLGGGRRITALLARCTVVALLVLALAGAQAVRTSDDLAVIFIVDRSSSVPEPLQQEAFGFIEAASAGLRPQKDRLGVIAFDGRTAVEQLPMGTLAIDRVSGAVEPERTDLAGALRMALALFPPDVARRVVVLSDGNENVGEALEEADQYAAAGVPVDVLPLRYAHESEVVFERLSAPATAKTDETVNLNLVLRANRPTAGEIRLYHNDKLVDLDPDSPAAGRRETLDAGPNRLQIPVPLRVAGAHRFKAEFVPDDGGGDTIAGNNVGQSFTVVSGQGRVLILTQELEPEVRSAYLLAEALERENLVCDVEVAGSEPVSQERLLGYSLVVLSNVPSHLLDESERRGLAVYVRDLGGGLIMVGGDQSFGAGGWLNTPIEDVMPVSFDVKAKRQIPKGALVMIMHGCEIPEGNYWAERVGIAAVKSLSSRDLVGVMSWAWRGGEQGYWDVPLQPVGDKGAVIAGIKRIQHGDMPDLEPVMSDAVDVLAARKDAATKHMILLSDFDPSPPTAGTLRRMKDNRITCSTVSIGWGSHQIDTGLAQQIADATGGKYYETRDVRELPRIFIKESQIVSRSLIQETPFTPAIASQLPTTIEGIANAGLPELGGYVITTAKPLAQVPLVRKTEEGADPLLAQWQVGLGKTVAFTSGMWNRWGSQWAGWPSFSKLWAQLARWASRQPAAAAFDVATSVQDGVGRIRIEALDADAEALNNLRLEGTLVNPAYDAAPLRLTQVGPGQYETRFDAQQAGSYVLNLAYRGGRGDAELAGTLQTGLSVAFSPEYRELRTNEALLTELARRTGGRLLTEAEAPAAFDFGAVQPAEARRSIWELLTRWLLLIFLIDVAVRRVAIHPLEWARKARRFVREMGNRGPAGAGEATLATLKGTRAAVRGERPASETGPAPQRGARYEGPVSTQQSQQDLNEALGGARAGDRPVVAAPPRKPKPGGEPDFTSRLLKAKKEARDKLRDEQNPEA